MLSKKIKISPSVIKKLKAINPVFEKIYKVKKQEIEKREINESDLCEIARISISQMLSNKSAYAIFNKLSKHVGDWSDREKVLNLKVNDFTNNSVSERKANCILDVFRKIKNREVDLSREGLINFSNEQITNLFCSFKGFGPWSAEMYMIFYLGRKDIISFKDLIVRKGLEDIFQKKINNQKQWDQLTSAIKPYGTAVSFLLWSHYGTN